MVRRVLRFLYEYTLFIIVLYVGYIVWAQVFQLAVVDYLNTTLWCRRGVWIGNSSIDLFDFTVTYQMEGYGDYSFFYVHWGYNMLNGVMPYSPDFGRLEMDGILNQNGLYIFPPLYAVLYAIGIMIPVDDYGIGIILAAFGYLTVFPVYGIAQQLSGNRHVGEAASITYLLNPSVLYHICFAWLNPSPFIFFFFLGFYAITKGKRNTGALLIVTAALFKQTAWFLGIPLVIYLLLAPRRGLRRSSRGTRTEDAKLASNDSSSPAQSEPSNQDEPESDKAHVEQKRLGALDGIFQPLKEYLDLKGFLVSAIVVVIYAGAVLFPFYLAQPDMFSYLSLAGGGFRLESFTEPPGYPSPMRLQVLAVMAGLPWLAEILDILVYYDFLLVFGVMISAGLMLLQPKDMDHNRHYLRRLLFLTMIMMLWVHLAGPRGVYKYYFTLFAPFFSIFSSVKMVTSKEERVGFSWSMLLVPVGMTLLYLLPSRNIYLLSVIFIIVGYLLAAQIGVFWSVVTSPGRWVKKMLWPHMTPVLNGYQALTAYVNRQLYPEAALVTTSTESR